MLGGDYLKRDIASFTDDYFTHARKQNPIRATVSLREEFPQAFNAFQTTGHLEFHTDLELFDRRWPGTFRRKIKRIEVFVQGLIPPDGVRGTLAHSGVSTEWKFDSGNWTKFTRVLPADSMLLSSYQYRRDLAVIQPPEDLLGLFENLGPQGTWVLDLPGSANDLDFQSVSDIAVVYYMDADVNDDLRAHTKALYGDQGARAFVLSSRFQYPDQWFRVDADKKVAFKVIDATFPRFVTKPKLTSFTVRLVNVDGEPALSGVALKITRESDSSTVNATTDPNGAAIGNQSTMAPFGAWKNDTPVDTFTVELPGNADLSSLADIQLRAVVLVHVPSRRVMKSGVDDVARPLPGGGGGINSIGDSFRPNLAMGGGSYRIPFELPHGPGGATPKLEIVYNTGLGTGPFGVGWSLAIPFIERRRPSPFTAPGEESFSISGSEPLIAMADGSFASESNAAAQRFTREGDRWEGRTPDLVLTTFGSTNASACQRRGRRPGRCRAVVARHGDVPQRDRGPLRVRTRRRRGSARGAALEHLPHRARRTKRAPTRP